MSSGRLIQRPLSDGKELKRAEKLKKPGQSGLGPSREHGLLPPSNIIEASTAANSLVGHVGF
jgi:hypothetical protein